MDFTKKRKTEENGTVSTSPPSQPTSLTSDDARKLLQPLTQDQLVEILQNAIVRHPDVLDSVRSVTDKDSTLRKLFIRGLGADTTSDSLRSLFSAFGELDEAIVILDKSTGKSKGYGFVTFKHADSALLALKEPSKKIDGRVTVTQFAAAGVSASFNNSSSSADVSARKIYVGSVPFDISSERLLSTFSTYGEIEEGPLGFDKATGKSKGFAFFVYKTEEGAKAALLEPIKNIDGHQVACKLAVDNKKSKAGGPQAPPGDHSGVPPQQSSMPGMFQGPPPQAGSYSGFPGGHQPGLVPPGNSFGGRYNANLGGVYGMPPPAEFNARMPPSSIGMPHGGFSDGPHYGLASSMALPSQHHHPPPPVPRVPPGGLYQGIPPYY